MENPDVEDASLPQVQTSPAVPRHPTPGAGGVDGALFQLSQSVSSSSVCTSGDLLDGDEGEDGPPPDYERFPSEEHCGYT